MWMRTLNEHQNIQYMCNVCNTVYMLWHYQGIECNLWRDKNIQLILFRNFAILHIILIWSQNLNPNLTFVAIEFVWLECYNSPIPSSKKVHQLNIDRMSAVLIVFGSCCVMRSPSPVQGRHECTTLYSCTKGLGTPDPVIVLWLIIISKRIWKSH